MDITRRQLLVGSLVAAGGLVLAGCGRDEGAGGGADPVAAPGFPVTLEHRFGTATIERPPQRVVTIGYSDHDAVLALGVPVAGIRYWYGPEDDAIQS